MKMMIQSGKRDHLLSVTKQISCWHPIPSQKELVNVQALGMLSLSDWEGNKTYTSIQDARIAAVLRLLQSQDMEDGLDAWYWCSAWYDQEKKDRFSELKKHRADVYGACDKELRVWFKMLRRFYWMSKMLLKEEADAAVKQGATASLCVI